MIFKLRSSFKPIGDQPQAIKGLIDGLKKGYPDQVLLGVTGSGKTFTLANVIAHLQKPTLVISHNKTLAAQLYQEFRDFFPQNAVSYFVSYYDYYQPESYLPQTDTYIEKETEINDLIDKLRLQATTNLMTRKDTIIVASVSCIYNLGSPKEYGHFVLNLELDQIIERKQILEKLTKLQYERSDYTLIQGTYRVRGETLDIFPAYEDFAYRVELENARVKMISKIDPLNSQKLKTAKAELKTLVIYPAKHYMTDPETTEKSFGQIREDLEKQLRKFEKERKFLEAQRLKSRVNYDLEMIKEVGYVNGIENYSRYFDGRQAGDPPFTLLDYFNEPYKKDWLCVIDESHMTVPQLNGMYRGDRSRKETLINFGFRLPAALDNRPLKFDEFTRRLPQTIYVSATPSPWEISRSQQVVEQLIRPTGLLDPEIILKESQGQIDDLIQRIDERVKAGERVLVTTLTKRMAEDLAAYLEERGTKVHYLHSDVETLDRTDILDDLREGKYDVLVGINLLREGLDLPEVSLVAILDADKEGFLRSETSLIQTMGRAARHLHGQVVMYADKITGSMQRAIDEVGRRRKKQLAYNLKFKITPTSIKKPIREKLVKRLEEKEKLSKIEVDQLTPEDKKSLLARLNRQMREASKNLNFELAVKIRDQIKKL